MTLKNVFFIFHLQNLPSCSINLPASLQNLPKFCSTWSNWCEDTSSEAQQDEITGNYNNCTTATSVNDQSSVATIAHTSFHVPPKYPAKYYYQRKMPFRRGKNWCGCLQVSVEWSIFNYACGVDRGTAINFMKKKKL